MRNCPARFTASPARDISITLFAATPIRMRDFMARLRSISNASSSFTPRERISTPLARSTILRSSKRLDKSVNSSFNNCSCLKRARAT